MPSKVTMLLPEIERELFDQEFAFQNISGIRAIQVFEGNYLFSYTFAL
jgi:hypothetical protein